MTEEEGRTRETDGQGPNLLRQAVGRVPSCSTIGPAHLPGEAADLLKTASRTEPLQPGMVPGIPPVSGSCVPLAAVSPPFAADLLQTTSLERSRHTSEARRLDPANGPRRENQMAGKRIAHARVPKNIFRKLDVLSMYCCVPSLVRVFVHAALGAGDSALKWLECAEKERTPWIRLFKVNPRFDPIRSAAAFRPCFSTGFSRAAVSLLQ